jgi:hypothetical protein
MMGTLMRLTAREDFITSCRRESFKSHITLLAVVHKCSKNISYRGKAILLSSLIPGCSIIESYASDYELEASLIHNQAHFFAISISTPQFLQTLLVTPKHSS